MTGWVSADQVFDGQVLQRDVAVQIEGGRIAAIAPLPKGASATAISGTICPGFIDMQVNGGGGVLLNQTPTPAGISAIAQAHRTLGTTSILPTVITDAPDVLQHAVEAVLTCATPGVLGLHIEGPHIAPTKRGTHAAQHVRPFEDATRGAATRLRQAGKTVIITLAPEVVAPEHIAELTALGVIVSLGHTDAKAGDMTAGFDAGARMVTHLYNAMSPMTHRAPGAVGAAIASDAYVGIIADGHHVDDLMIGLALRARPMAGRSFLVSDAMPTVGGADQFDLYGQTIRLDHGRLVNAEGNLAGAHGTMASGVRRLVQNVGLGEEEALQMATTVPAAAIGQPDLAQLQGQRASDVLVLDADLGVSGTLDIKTSQP